MIEINKERKHFCFFLLLRKQIQVLAPRKKVNSRNQRKLYLIHKIRTTRKKYNHYLEIMSMRAKKNKMNQPNSTPEEEVNNEI